MIFKLSESETIFSANGALGRKMFSNGKNEIVHLKLEKKAIIDTHSLDINVKFFILKGRAEVLLDNERIIIEKNDLVYVEPGINRKWINIGDTDLEVLVIKQLT